ncbi:MAG: hypothetical protein ACXWXO_15490 [Nocardioides sp.]
MITATPSDRSTSRSHVVALVLGVTALFTLIVTAFAWPASEIAPEDLPVAVVGPAEAVAGFEAGTAAIGADAFEVVPLDSRGAAVSAIEDREVSAAFVMGPQGAELLTASAGSPAVAQLMAQVAANLAADQPDGPALTTTDVVPLPAEDPRGLVFSSGSLPIVLGGILTGALVALRVRRGLASVLATLGVAVGGGLATVAVLQGWLGALDGSYGANAGVVALGIAATALAVVGLRRLVGPAGIALTGLTILLLGNPLSGVTSAPELLPGGWSTLGQLLPPGATGTALRSMAFFDGAGAGLPLLVLGCWALAGAGLALLPERRRTPEPVTGSREAELQPA